MSLKDQEFIYEMTLKWKEINKKDSEVRSRDIFIVHNYKTISDEKELMELWDIICQLYPGDKSEEDSVPYFSSNKYFCRHVILANHSSNFGKIHNTYTFTLLKKWISSIVKKDKNNNLIWKTPLDGVKIAMNETITKYISGIKEVTLDTNNGLFKLVPIEDELPCVIDSLNPNVGNISSFKPLSRTSIMPNGDFLIMLEVPSVDENSIECEPKMNSDKLNTWIIVVSGFKNDVKMENEKLEKDDFSYGRFEEKFYIPITHSSEVEPEKSMEQGILRIIVPKRKVWGKTKKLDSEKNEVKNDNDGE